MSSKYVSIVLLIIAFFVLLGWEEAAIGVLVCQAAVGVIEARLIYKGEQVITNWYVPLLPKSIDMPISIAVPVALIIKAACIWTAKGQITLWWAVAAMIECWIVAHLCSYERK